MPISLKGATSGDITLTAAAVAGANTLTLPAATGTLIYGTQPSGTIVGTSDTQTLTNKTLTSPIISGSVAVPLTIAAGTNSSAPLILTSGTNLTTAAAGAVEYDGRVFYGTPVASQRGLVPTNHLYRLDGLYAGSNVNTAQSMFGVGVSLAASTVYRFEIVCALTKSAGNTSHTISLLFGGTATLNNIFYHFSSYSLATSATTAINTSKNDGYVTAATATVASSAIAATSANFWASIRGTVSINAAGTLIPQYQLSAAPGGAYSTVAGSYIILTPIGASGSATSIGNWA